MNAISKLKSAATKVIELPNLTQDLRDAGEIGPGDVVQVRLRRVRAAEVIAETGTTPLLYSLARDRQQGETDAEFAARLQDKMLDDPQAIQDTQRQHLATQVAVVTLGVIGISIAPVDAPAWEPLTLTANGEATVDILGRDLELVHDAVTEFASLPYGRMGRAAGTEAFPAREPSASGEPGSSGVRADTEPVP